MTVFEVREHGGVGVTSSDFPPREERNSIPGRRNSAARQMAFVRNRMEVCLAGVLGCSTSQISMGTQITRGLPQAWVGADVLHL